MRQKKIPNNGVFTTFLEEGVYNKLIQKTHTHWLKECKISSVSGTNLSDKDNL